MSIQSYFESKFEITSFGLKMIDNDIGMVVPIRSLEVYDRPILLIESNNTVVKVTIYNFEEMTQRYDLKDKILRAIPILKEWLMNNPGPDSFEQKLKNAELLLNKS